VIHKRKKLVKERGLFAIAGVAWESWGNFKENGFDEKFLVNNHLIFMV
jgi:hypothetical protein